MSYADTETKKFLLRVAWVLPASKAIGRSGDSGKWKDAASQLRMGDMLGQDRSTTNRNLRMFCGENATIAQFFKKWRPGIGCVNNYSHVRPEDEMDKRKVLKTLDPEKLAEKFGADRFDAGAEGCSGSGPVALWTFDKNLPEPIRCGCRLGQMKFNFNSRCLKCGGKGHTFDPGRKMGPNPRTLLTVLQLKGIAHFGYLEMTCAALGRLSGLCENTVATCLDQWEDLKVLQIVPGRVVYEPGTNAVKFRYPQRIIWLPGQLLDHDIVARERLRFEEAAKLVFLNFGLTPSLAIARQRHAELLAMWQLSRHSLGSLWSYLRTWLIRRENCEREQVDMLFPLHKAWDDG